MGHDGEKPLVATYTNQRPPWIGLWSCRPYTGRVDWWKEPGLEDNMARDGKLRFMKTRFREEDPDWYDPKVPDGTSLPGPYGLDSRKYKNTTKKGDQPGDLDHFQDKVMKSSHQYKAIAEQWPLSKEHPGLAVNPTLNHITNMFKFQLGQNGWPNSLLPSRLNAADTTFFGIHFGGENGFFPTSFIRGGPKFFDAPLNEGAFWKGLACAKYAAMFMLPYTMLHIRAFPEISTDKFRPRYFVQKYVKSLPFPVTVAFAWGFSLSAAATIRNKDDIYNHLYSSAATGTVVATMKQNIAMGVTVAVVSTILGSFWQYARVSETGLQGMAAQPTSAGIWGGPLLWKMLSNHGDKKVPDIQY